MTSTSTAARTGRLTPADASTRVPAWSSPRVWVPAVMIAAVAGILLATARWGVGLTPDSVVYLTGARSIADGDGFTHLDGSAIGSWPPGYSAVLAIGELLGIDALDGARLVSVAGMLAMILLAYILLRRHVRSNGIRAAATVVVGCSAVLLEVYAKALSEHLFVPVLLAFVLVCERLVERPASGRLLAAAVVLSWAAFYLRYVGIVTVLIGALIAVAASWKSGAATALVRAGGFAVAAASLPAIWMFRNVDSGGDPMGPRADASFTLASNVRRVANEASQWVATQVAPPAVRAIALAAVLAILALLAVAVARRRAALPDDWKSIVPLAMLVALYVGYLVVSASVVAFGAINTRFLLPVFVPVVILGAWLFERVRDQLPPGSMRTLLTTAGVVWVAVNVVWFAGRAAGYAQDGAGGYATERWHDSALLHDVQELDFTTTTYTNDVGAVDLFAGEFALRSPARTYFNSDTETGDLQDFIRTVTCEGHVQLIWWFTPLSARSLYDLRSLEERVRLEPVVERSDGSIYDVSPREGAAACTP